MDIPISNLEFSDLIGEIYEAGLTGQWTALLDQILDITQSNKTFIYLKELSSETPLFMEFRTNFDYPAALLKDYYNRTSEDPYYKAIINDVEGESIDISKRICIDYYQGSSFYENILIPFRSYQVFGGVLIRDGLHESFFAINRGREDPTYSEQDFNLFQMITPHMARAVQTFKSLQLYKYYANITKSILEQTDKGIIVCDEQSNITLCNDYADKKVKDLPEFNCTDGKLKLQDEMLNRQLTYYIHECAVLSYSGIGRQETIVLDRAGASSVLLTVAPLKDQSAFNDMEVRCCLVTISLRQAVQWQAVFREFALTPREQQLLQAIYNKKKLNDLTAVFGVSYNTLRTHLQSIFRKAQVNSQTELMIRLNQFQQGC